MQVIWDNENYNQAKKIRVIWDIANAS